MNPNLALGDIRMSVVGVLELVLLPLGSPMIEQDYIDTVIIVEDLSAMTLMYSKQKRELKRGRREKHLYIIEQLRLVVFVSD